MPGMPGMLLPECQNAGMPCWNARMPGMPGMPPVKNAGMPAGKCCQNDYELYQIMI